MPRRTIGFEGVAPAGGSAVLDAYAGLTWTNTVATDRAFLAGSGTGFDNARRGDAAATNGLGGEFRFRRTDGDDFTMKKALFAATDGVTLHLVITGMRDGGFVSQLEVDITEAPQVLRFGRLFAHVDEIAIAPTQPFGEATVLGLDNLVVRSDSVW